MKITPLEIRQKKFETQFRGYEKEEVYAFLQALSFEWEHLNNDLRETKAKLEVAEKDVQKMREVESSLYKALKTAEDTGNSMVDQASKAAQLQLKEAQMDSEMLLNEAKKQARNLIEEAEEAAKGAVESAKYEIQKLEQDYNTIANHRENLLHDLKNIASDAMDRASRYLEKPSNVKFDLPETSDAASEDLLDFSVTEKKEPIIQFEKREEEDEVPAIEKIQEEKAEEVEFEVNTSFTDADSEVRIKDEPKQGEAIEKKKDVSSDDEEQSSFFDQI